MQSSIVQKLLTVLSVVSEAKKPLTFSEIVERTGLNKSTIHRLLAIGVEESLLRFDAHGKVYFLGTRVFDLVRNAYDGYDIQTIALDEMTRLFDQFKANVTLGVPGGHEVTTLRVLEASDSLRGVQRPGTRDPIHCSASGKALVAFYPEQKLRSLLDDYDFQQFTDRTITTAPEFIEELQRVRAQGFGWNDREEYEQFVGIAAPVFNYIAEPIAVLNIWSSLPKHNMDDLLAWSDALKSSAARVTEMIGGIGPAQK